jgi:hypothetical protein
MMKIRLLAVTALMLLLEQCFAQDTGTFAFLRSDVSARAAALNGSFVSMTADPNVVFYNPASLVTISTPQVSLGYLKNLLDVNSGSLAFAQNLEGIGNIGVGITYVDYGSFTRTDQSNNDLGSFSASELALVAGYGMMLDEQ